MSATSRQRKRPDGTLGPKEWRTVLYLGRDHATGKKRYVEGKTFATKREAEAALLKMRVEYGNGDFVPLSDRTLADYVETTWLPTCKTQVKATTFRNYEAVIKRYLVPLLGSRRMRDLSAAEITAAYSRMLVGDLPVEPRRTRAEAASTNRTSPSKKPRPRKNRSLSKKTVTNAHVLLRKILSDAVDDGLISRNPAEKAKPPRATPPEIQAWSAHQMRAFLEWSEGKPYEVLWNLLANTGIRRGEALGLRWRDVDLVAGTISIRQNLVVTGPDTIGFSTPKSGQARVLDIGQRTCDALRTHRKKVTEERLAFGAGYERSDLVFPRADGSPQHPDTISKQFTKALGAAMENEVVDLRITLHGLRHAHATLLLKEGIPVKVVSERLGHSDPAFTMRVYQHVLPSMQRHAAAVFETLVSEAEADEDDATEPIDSSTKPGQHLAEANQALA